MYRDASEQAADRQGAWALLALALGLSLLLAIETLLRGLGYVDFRETSLVLDAEYLIGVLTTIPFLLGVGYGAFRLLHSPEYGQGGQRILKWTLAVVGVSVLINVLLMLVTPDVNRWYAVAWLRWATALGSGVGMLVGVLEQRAIRNAREAERARVTAEHLEQQRDTMDYLNSLLRHEILNGVNVIEGHSQLAAEMIDNPNLVEAHIDPVIRRSRDIENVVSDVRTLLQVIKGSDDLKTINLRSTIDREVTKVEDEAPEAEISVDLPEDTYVEGDYLIGRIYGNVLVNAVEHNDSEPPRISVEGRQSDGDVIVDISDNGPGIGTVRGNGSSSVHPPVLPTTGRGSTLSTGSAPTMGAPSNWSKQGTGGRRSRLRYPPPRCRQNSNPLLRSPRSRGTRPCPRCRLHRA